MSKMKELYDDICFYIDDHYDDDEIAMELGIPEQMVKDARQMHNKWDVPEVTVDEKHYKHYNVMICFGAPTTKLTDYMLKDLKEAVDHAQHYLYTRHRIKIPVGAPERQDEYTAYLELIDTKGVLTEKNIGVHLRGIATYLLKTYPEKYEPLKDGNRLIYCDVF